MANRFEQAAKIKWAFVSQGCGNFIHRHIGGFEQTRSVMHPQTNKKSIGA